MWVRSIFFVLEWHDRDTIPESNMSSYSNKINQHKMKMLQVKWKLPL